MKKALLASTALVGAALLSAPAQAGTVGSGDNLAVRLSGFMWFQAHVLDEQGSQRAGFGRGYDFDIPETEVHINASNTADNGIKYGVSIEMEVNTDASDNGDEVWAFLSGDFGRIEMGDQDDVTNRMLVGAFQAHKGISGPFGGLGGVFPVFHNGFGAVGALGSPYLYRTDIQAATSSDRTKVIYFSPRFSGFQVGASFTPDSGANGASFGETDNDTSFNNMISLGLNYTGKFDDVGVSATVSYETAEQEIDGADNVNEDLELLHIGAKVDFAGFTVGANYRDNGDSTLSTAAVSAGADQGDYWAVGAGYQQGPWGVSAWYSLGERDVSSSVENTVERWGLGARYAIAPGWQVRADYNNATQETTGSEDLKAQAFILTNMFNF
ncbi:MAG: porin [Alphaproteobacteria bacterium]|nr:porin [Alphaproteobacteria bacterium]